jgi:hypothetical protein
MLTDVLAFLGFPTPSLLPSPPLPLPLPTPLCSGQADDAGIVLSLESHSSEALAAACKRLKAELPEGAVLSEHIDSSAINTPAATPPAAGGLAPAAQ